MRLLSFLPGKEINPLFVRFIKHEQEGWGREGGEKKINNKKFDSLPGSIAAEMRDCASRTLFMASSISLLDASDFRPMLAAMGFILEETTDLHQTRFEIKITGYGFEY